MFVKSKTWSDIPIHQYLSPDELKQAYCHHPASPLSTPRSTRHASSQLHLLAEGKFNIVHSEYMKST